MADNISELPWGFLLALATTFGGTALGYGSLRNMVAGLKESLKDYKGHLETVDLTASTNRLELQRVQLDVERTYVRKDDFGRLETNLKASIGELKDHVAGVVSGLRTDISQKGIEHTIRNSIQNAMARDHLVAKGKISE